MRVALLTWSVCWVDAVAARVVIRGGNTGLSPFRSSDLKCREWLLQVLPVGYLFAEIVKC